jgi:hypothetical protein
MIDNSAQTQRLLEKLQAALPLSARTTPELITTLRARNAALAPTADCRVTWISYAGDEGGIVCRLSFGGDIEEAAFVSITHLRFDPRLPLAREIVAYQKHRVKRLRRQPA